MWLIVTDIGFQGMVYVSDDTPYMKLLAPFLAKKKASRTPLLASCCSDTGSRSLRPILGVVTTSL
jgi:hypothetical protein